MRYISHFKVVFSIGAVVVGVIALVCIYLQHKLMMHFFMNSDALYLPTLYIDLFRNGGSLKDWFLTPAPYFVPDWPIYFLAMRIFGLPYLAVAAFFVVQILLSFALVTAINRRFSEMPNALAGAAFSISFCCLLSARLVEPFSFALISAYHYGAFLMLLLALWLVIGGIQKKTVADAKKQAYGVFAVTALAALSDKLFLIQFSLPALAALLYMSIRSRIERKTAITFMLAICAGSVLGPLLYKAMASKAIDTPAGFGMENLSRNLHDLLAIVRGGMDGNAYAMAIVVLFYLSVAALPWLAWRAGKVEYKPRNELLFVAVFSLCSGAVLVLVELFNKMLLNGRYLIPLFLAPILFSPTLILGYLKKAAAEVFGVLLLFASAICIFALVRLAAENDASIKTDFYPADVACIDGVIGKYGLRNGIAEYWDAKRVSVLSKTSVNIAQVFQDLSAHQWITTTATFKNAYDFALINLDSLAPVQPNEQHIVEINGAPAASVQCGKIKVLVYPQSGLTSGNGNH